LRRPAALEEGVRKDVEGACRPPGYGDNLVDFTGAQGEHHVAQLRERGVGENPLDVFLRAGDNRSKDHGEGTHPQDERECVFANGEEREQARDQVDAGDDHRGAVDYGTHGRRAFHGVGKPNMHGEHGGLAPAAGKDEHGTYHEGGGLLDFADSQVDGCGLECRKAERVQNAKVKTADHVAHHHDAEQKETVGKAGEDKCLLGGAHGGGLVVPETDEQVARDAHELPKDEHLEQVGGDDETEHAEAEQREQAKEPPRGTVFAHVANAVDVHHETDEGDDHEHHDREGVHEHADFGDQVAYERDKDVLEESRLLRSEVRTKVVDRDGDGACGGKAIAGDRDGGCRLVELAVVAKEEPVHHEREQRQ